MIVSVFFLPLSYWFIRLKQIERTYVNAIKKELNNKNFFCYNNRKSGQSFVEITLSPLLSSEIELIYLDGKILHSSYDKQLIFNLLHHLQNYSKFPHLIKIRNGRVIDQSINNDFFNTLNQDKPIEHLLDKIECFFKD